MKKYMAMLAAVLLMLCSFTACGEDLATPEEMFETIKAAEDLRVEMVIRYDDGIQTSTTIIEEDGDRSHVRMETESFGAIAGDEYYTGVVDGKRYIYSQNTDGSWKKELLQDWFTPASAEGLKAFFDSDLYYVEEGHYRMYKTGSTQLSGIVYNDVELEVMEDGSYCITAVISESIDGLQVYGSATITISIDDVTVTLPKAE